MMYLKRGVCLTLLLIVTSTTGHGAFAGGDKDIPVTTRSEAAMLDFVAGQAALDAGDGVFANVLFRSAVEKDPNFAYAWSNLATSAFSTREFSESLAKAGAAAEHASDGERMLIDINMRFLDNDFESQLATAKKLAEAYPDSARAWTTLAGVQANLNKFDDERMSLRKAIETDAHFAPAYVAMTNSYVFNRPKDFDKAAQYCRKVLAMEPAQDNHYWLMGDVYRAKKQLEEARGYYTLSAQLDPHNGTAFTKRGHVNSFLGNFSEARADYDKAYLAGQPITKSFLANYRAFVAVYEGSPERAVSELKKIAAHVDELDLLEQQRSGARNFALTNAAVIAMHSGLHDEAASLLKKRATLMRLDAKAVGTEEFSNIQEANIAFMTGQLAARRGDLKEAGSLAKKNRDLVSGQDNPRKMENYHALMGLIDLQQENFASAVQHYRKADLNNVYVKHHLALAMSGAGQRQEARTLFREVADWNFNSVGYALIREEAISRSS